MRRNLRSFAPIIRGVAAAALLLLAAPVAAAPSSHDLNVKTDCGAVGNGVVDDTGRIQHCIERSAATGQAVYIPTGRYRITAPLAVSSSNTTIYGTGSSRTLIVQDAPASPIFRIGEGRSPIDRIALRGLTLFYSSSHPTGIAVICRMCWRTYFQRLSLGGGGAGAHLSSGLWVSGGNQVFVEDSVVTNDTSQGLYFSNVGDVFLSNVEVNQRSDDTKSTGIIFDTGVGGIYAVNVNVTAGETAFLFENTQHAVPPNFGFFTNCLADTVNGVGWHFKAATSMRLTNSWAATASNYGIMIENDVDGLSITDSRIYNNGLTGTLLRAGARNVSVKASTISGNSRLAPRRNPGIYIEANVSNFQILDNVIGAADGFSNSQSYGVVIAPGSSDDYMIVANDLHGNARGGLRDDASGTHAVTANNL